MARINIEESWWTDPRRELLSSLIGDPIKADGLMIRVWRLAQQYRGKGNGLIPQDIWSTIEANASILQAKLAKAEQNGVYVNGSSELHDWIIERRENAKKGGKSSAGKRSKRQANVKQTEANVKQTQPSYSSSGSYSVSDSSSFSGVCDEQEPVAPQPFKTPVVELIEIRKELHQKVHACEPIGGAQVNGMLSNLVKAVGLDDAKAILRYFYSVPNNYYKTNAHELSIMLKDKAKLLTEVRRQAPILPDARAKSFEQTKNTLSLKDELLRRAAAREAQS